MFWRVLVYGWRILFLGAGLALLALGNSLAGVFLVALGVQRLGWQLAIDLGGRAIALLRISESLGLIGNVALVTLAVEEIMAGEWEGWVFVLLGLGNGFWAALLLWATFRAKGWDGPNASAGHDVGISEDGYQRIQP